MHFVDGASEGYGCAAANLKRDVASGTNFAGA
ncbi:hypothetical protein JQ553_29655 [Bradyrhizobium lablabi]|nr:hypothetical protein [Bradyrhizobium lablabi]